MQEERIPPQPRHVLEHFLRIVGWTGLTSSAFTTIEIVDSIVRTGNWLALTGLWGVSCGIALFRAFLTDQTAQ